MVNIFRKSEQLLASANETTAYAPTGSSYTTGYSGVFTPSTMPLSIFHDVDSSAFPVTTGEALSVPAVYRAVLLYSALISRLPLKGPAWLVQTQGAITPALRLARTVQDLILVGACVWSVTRDEDGYVNGGNRVEPSRWKISADGLHILIDNEVQPDSSVVFFSSLMPTGFLESGRDSVRHYTNIARTINNRTSVPEPATLIHPTTDFQATEDEIDETIARLSEVLQSRRGGIVYVPAGLEIGPYAVSDSANAVMIEARQAVRTDLANFLGISAAILDGTQTGAGDVYTNALQSQSELLEFSVKSFSEPIADRLAQLDVSPPGERVRFDYSQFDSIADAAGNIGAPRPSNPVNTEVSND